jgi:hypothetical protein
MEKGGSEKEREGKGFWEGGRGILLNKNQSNEERMQKQKKILQFFYKFKETSNKIDFLVIHKFFCKFKISTRELKVNTEMAQSCQIIKRLCKDQF